MNAPKSQLGNVALALGARLGAGAAAAAVNNATSTSGGTFTTSTVDLASVVAGGALWATSKKWNKFGMWLAVIGGVDYLNPMISPTIVKDAPQLQGRVL